MRVVLKAGIFTTAGLGELGTLCYLGLTGKHRLQVEDPGSPQVLERLAKMDPDDQAEWELALERGAREEPMDYSAFEIHVADATSSDWGRERPQLTLTDALRLLSEPFRILLEDDTTDRAFLLSMAEPEQRRFFDDYEQQGFLKFEHGGGLDKMLGKVKKEDLRLSFGRLWVLFDSDCLQPGEPSQSAQRLAEQCGSEIPFHMLKRRSMENYLPLNALRVWAFRLPPRRREKRVATFEAFKSMSDDQRRCFNMKHGFAKDRERKDATAGELYADLSRETFRSLENGFSPRVGKLFEDSSVSTEDLRADGDGWTEIHSEVTKLMRYIQ